MREVAIVAYAVSPLLARDALRTEVEMLLPVIQQARVQAGGAGERIGFTVSGSCDYLAGMPFSFVGALDAAGAWPSIAESHVEMDGAFALYEAFVRLQHGDIDAALVYAFGKPSGGDLRQVLAAQLDPYFLQPLGVDQVALAALQAQQVLERTNWSQSDAARVSQRSMSDGLRNPDVAFGMNCAESYFMERPQVCGPLRQWDVARCCDGVAAVVLAAGDLARASCARPAWIRGIDHRIETHYPGNRALWHSASMRLALERSGALRDRLDVVELHAATTYQELILRDALELDERHTRISPSGGALVADPTMVTGLIRLGEAARRLWQGDADRVLAHASSGPCLQQNLVAVLEGD